ncbi:MAG TPA: TlpA disulfide reductase family protein [Solirubrobacteraceae bacterium]|nr:TlpA disulfide reductase family protein [Solirubrobacteraceae bacterium]
MRRQVRNGALAVGVLAVVVVGLVLGLSSSKTPAGGRVAPALPHESLAGRPVTIASLLASAHGRPAAVVFWASWCGPCEHEAPAIERFARSAAGRGRVAGVDWSDARSGAVSFIEHYRWTFPNARDAEGTVGNAYRITSLPTTFVIEPDGRIADELHGPQDEASLARALARARKT